MGNNGSKKKIGTCFTQVHPKGEENFDTIEDTECFCPQCGKVYPRQMKISYITDPDIWKMNGYIVIRCISCKTRHEMETDRVDGVTIEPPQLAVMQMNHANRIKYNSESHIN